ncbi:MAG TPA: glycosyltransferase family 39 protein [Anaerolineales bacterium]|nr:glycosyltransferase family 39 protein [Anaerolineales bacterium]
MNGTQFALRDTQYVIRPAVYCFLLSAFFALSLSQLTSTSPTFDEGFTLLRGYAALRTGHLVPLGHPPLAHWLSATGVLLEPNLPDPRTLDGWYGDKYDDSSRDLLWHRGLNANRIVFLGRLPILFLGLILGAVTARWAKDLFGWQAAIAALAFHALSPNLLAHSALATTDLPVAAFYVFTLYRWHRFTLAPTAPNAALTGFMLGLALASKFNALLLLPTLVILGAIQLFRLRITNYGLRFLRYSAFIIPPSAFLALWATYGFALNPYPLAQYIRELTDLTSLASEGHTAYLLGQLSLNGWWYYHLVVLAVKTPLPLIILITYAFWHILSHRALRWDFGIWIIGFSSGLYLLATVTLFSLNVGYRYLLPALPLLHLLAASVAQSAIRNTNRVSRLTFVVLLLWHLISTLSISPHFLAYFNELVGPANGYKVLSDSNLDWGQDLPALAKYLNGRRVYLSYFGLADPAYYGIKSDPLPAWPPPPETRFAPADPAPGLYAISASNLVGVQLDDPNTFAYFRDLKPLTVINYSIFIYEIPLRDPITIFAQCTPPILNQNAIAKLLDNRAVREITFDCATSRVIPSSTSLLLYPESQTPISTRSVQSPIFEWNRSDASTYYRLYRTSPASPSSPLFPSKYLSLLDFELTQEALTLSWRVDEPATPPVSIFVHFNWPDGALAEAYDALGFPAEQWQTGDVIIQRHPISPDLPPGEYPIVVGLYSLADGTRYSEILITTYIK